MSRHGGEGLVDMDSDAVGGLLRCSGGGDDDVEKGVVKGPSADG